MAYDPTDLRSRLSGTAPATATSSPRAAGVNVAPQYFEFDRLPPTEKTDRGGSSWWVRSQACVLNYFEVKAGDRLERRGQPDEYVVLLPDEASRVTFTTGGEPVEVEGRALVVVPPGDGELAAETDATIVRLFTSQSPDLCALCDNADFYATPDPNVAEFRTWPDPPDGYGVRVYPVDEVSPDRDRFGRIFRCTTFMVNWFYEDHGPRDPAKLSPHHHDDFEQLSLQLAGDYVHHIRTPWTVDMAQWRNDDHQHCTSPAVTVIPPPAIHTSQSVGDTAHQLIDIFAPPRSDFSAQPGWVLNDDHYPAPAT